MLWVSVPQRQQSSLYGFAHNSRFGSELKPAEISSRQDAKAQRAKNTFYFSVLACLAALRDEDILYQCQKGIPTTYATELLLIAVY